MENNYHLGYQCHQGVHCEMHTTAFSQHPRQKKQNIVCGLETLGTFKKY